MALEVVEIQGWTYAETEHGAVTFQSYFRQPKNFSVVKFDVYGTCAKDTFSGPDSFFFAESI
jgi:hypothetical protein